MASSNYVTDKVQKAFAAYLATQTLDNIPATNIYSGIRSGADGSTQDPSQLPCVIFSCQSAESDADAGAPHWVARLTARIRTHSGDNSEDDHHAQAEEVLNLLTTDTIQDDVTSALVGFTAFQVVPAAQAWALNGEVWEAMFEFDVYCVGDDVA